MKESSPSSDFYTKTCCQLIGLDTKLDANKIAPNIRVLSLSFSKIIECFKQYTFWSAGLSNVCF